MKIGTLTFHGAHNYGSVLQAYALQEVIDGLVGKDNHEIINLRKQSQKDYYGIYNKGKKIKTFIANIYNYKYRKDLKEKYNKFEYFINQILPLSKEINEYKQVEGIIDSYDTVICGSDQIWNISSFDFDLSYLLAFQKGKIKKISYAASFGGDNSIIEKNKDLLKKYLSEFDALSVREIDAQDKLSKMIDREVLRVPDPTLLLGQLKWKSLVEEKNYVDDEYILFYSLGPSPEDIKLVNYLSHKLGYKIIITNTANRNDKMMKAERHLDSGPLDFLNLIKNAKLVCTSSFHCTVFSILFEVPFFCLNVENEERLKSLLKITELEDRHISNEDMETKILDVFTNIDFANANRKLEHERKNGINYLIKALGVENDLQ